MVVRGEQVLGLILSVGLAVACTSKKEKVESQPVVIMEDDRKTNPLYAPDPNSEGAENEENAAPTSWGEEIAATVKTLKGLVTTCHKDWILTFDPDNLLLGRPAVYAPDGVVTHMEKACEPIVTLLDDHFDNFVSKHPETDRLLREWTLFADLYRRAYRFGTNVGAPAKRRKLNHSDLVTIRKELVESTVPALMKSASVLAEWNDENKVAWPSGPASLAPKQTATHWRKHIKATLKESHELKTEWMKRGHNLRKKGLFPRDRFLDLLGRLWRDRIARDRAKLDALTTGDINFDRALRTSVSGFYTAMDNYMTEGWDVAMDAFSASNVLDEPKLKLGKDNFKKALKVLQKAAKRVKIPSAG
jgi:hypothetical protein